MKKLFAFTLTALALSACTKKQPYTSEYKGFKDDGSSEVISKGVIAEKTDYLYSSAGLDMSRRLVGGQPFSFGTSKRVQLEWTPDSLRVIEHEADARYRKDINDKIVLEIPIDNVDFECAPDAYGECTSQEREKTDIPWNQKTRFRLKAASAKMGAAEILPIIDEQYFGDSKAPCFNEVSSQVVSYSVKPEAINLEVKRIFTQSLSCMSELDSLTDTSVSAVFHYSFVRADKILTKDFKPIPYDFKDENTFGFFKTVRNVLDVDNNQAESLQVRLLNHWDSNRTNIDYYLSEEFNHEGNEYIKELTHEAVRRLNSGLQEAGAKFHITLHDPEGKNPGDIRNSMILLVEDPDATGLLGYGPQTEDPQTGEIVSARTVMFLAGFEQEARLLYDDIGRKVSRGEAAGVGGSVLPSLNLTSVGSPDSTMKVSPGVLMRTHSSIEAPAVPLTAFVPVKAQSAVTESASDLPSIASLASSPLSESQLQQMKADLDNEALHRNAEYLQGDLQSYVKYLREVKNCALGAEFGSLKAVRPELSEQILKAFGDGRGGLRAWASLNTDERRSVVKTIISEIWIPVVLHEMGHNMGLRHNFKGSFDKDSFYTAEELGQKKINYQIPYSSIMEYGDNLHELPILGKYDIAALRYAYARQVEVQNKDATGTVLSSELRSLDQSCDSSLVPQSLNCLESHLQKENSPGGSSWSLRKFGFCTDDNLGASMDCRQFDEGTTYSEIADYLIRAYKDGYNFRNFRNDALNFSSTSDGAVLAGRYARLAQLRIFLENYEFYKHFFNLPDDSPAFQSIAWLNDIKTAALKSANFYVDLLEVPDLSCVIASSSDPHMVLGALPLSQMQGGQRAMDCRNLGGLPPEWKIVGEVGKFFNDRRDPNSKNPLADQIDVRGYYLDKMAAAKILFRRTLGGGLSADNDYADNAWDIADLRDRLRKVTLGLITNHLVSEQPVTWYDGSPSSLLKLDYDSHNAMVVNQPLAPGISKQLGLPYQVNYFANILADEIRDNAYAGPNTLASGNELKALVGVRILNNMDQQPPRAAISAVIDTDRTAYTGSSNLVANELIADLQMNRVLGAIWKASRPDAQGKVQRTVFPELIRIVASKVGNLAAQSTASSLTEDDLKPVSGLQPGEAQQIVALSKWLGNGRFMVKLTQLAQGALMPETEILKTLEWLPTF